MGLRVSAVIVAGFLIQSCSKPIAAFSVQEGTQHAPANVKFHNESQKAKSYEWDFGDGKMTKDTSPEHRYTASGNYIVTLKAISGTKKNESKQVIQVQAPHDCLVQIETAFGNMTIQLYDATPQHRDNFIKLVEEGYYNDLLFHRVISGFMIQGGDPMSRNSNPAVGLGGGGPGYEVPAEFVDTLIHVKGALAAARTGDGVNPEKKSSGSQFYIVDGKPVTEAQLDQYEASKNFHYSMENRADYLKYGGTPFLDREYTIFGRVVEGLDVIDKIAAQKTGRGDRPEKDVKMKMKVIK